MRVDGRLRNPRIPWHTHVAWSVTLLDCLPRSVDTSHALLSQSNPSSRIGSLVLDNGTTNAIQTSYSPCYLIPFIRIWFFLLTC